MNRSRQDRSNQVTLLQKLCTVVYRFSQKGSIYYFHCICWNSLEVKLIDGSQNNKLQVRSRRYLRSLVPKSHEFDSSVTKFDKAHTYGWLHYTFCNVIEALRPRIVLNTLRTYILMLAILSKDWKDSLVQNFFFKIKNYNFSTTHQTGIQKCNYSQHQIKIS